MRQISRRQFLRRVSTVAAASTLTVSLPASLARASDAAPDAAQTLAEGWEFLRMPLAGPWEVWINPPLAPWTAVTVPHCFNNYDGCDPVTPAYRGKGWYRRHLAIANPYPNGRVLLHFEGAGQSSEIYIDRILAGAHTGGYDEFVVDITDALQQPRASGKNGALLSVMCDNSPNMERMPSDLSDFTLYGGLYRKVHLAYVPAVSIAALHIEATAPVDKPAHVKVLARLYSVGHTNGSVQVTVSVTNLAGLEIHRVTAKHALWDGKLELTSFEVATPQLWSPRTPNLYRCKVTVLTDAGESVKTERFGLRSFEFVERGPFFLNGERLLIQGTHRHEDHAGYAAAMPAELIRTEMQMIKDMGANFIRLAHYQQQKLVLDLCDELGLLVWEEVPWCRAGVGDAAFQQQGHEKLTAMIDQHCNHPSIILWGLGNEDDWEGEYPSVDQKAIREYMQQLRDLAHKLDRSRLTSFRRADFARDIPDVYAPSIWAGWYGGRFVDYEASLTAQNAKSTRMLHTEWGADSHAGRHAEDPYKTLVKVKTGDTAERGQAYLLEGGTPRVSSEGDWSESYACDLFDWHLKVQQSLPWLAGAVHWVFKDFTTPLRPENPVPRVNQKGVVERDLTKKEGYFVFQSYWSEKPMVHLYGHSWPVRWGKAGELRTVKVYSNCPTAELFVNGASAGVRKRDILDFPAAGLRWEVPFQDGKNELHVIANVPDGTMVSDEISFVYQTEPWGEPAKLTLRVLDKSAHQAIVETTLLDAKGHLCLDARNVVHFTQAGDGHLIDNLGTSTGSRIVQLHNGRARIAIKYGKGMILAGVSSEGIPAVFCPMGG